MKTNTLTAITALLLSATTFVSCSKEEIARPASATESNTAATSSTTDDNSLEAPAPATTAALAYTGTTTTTTTPYKIAVNYSGRANSLYGLTQSQPDYKTVSYWSGTRSTVSNGTLTTKLAKYMVGPSGGTLSKMNVPDAAEYTLSFGMKFDSNFDFSYGGKVGFGLLIGNGYTGGTPGWDGNGGSARIMWYKQNGRVYLKPYIYYKDQPIKYGNDFGKTYPATGNISKGVWHNVKMYVKANTGSNTDGRITISINGVVLLDQAIRWTTNDASRLVKDVVFETFRGGSESYWQSATDGNISFNNINYGVGKL